MNLALQLADKRGLAWAQHVVSEYHYLRVPVDVRCMPVAYLAMLGETRVGCLIFGRPESTRCNGWYGSVEDVETGRCAFTRWQVLNLARVWLDPCVQRGGSLYAPNAATALIAQGLRRIVFDYLIMRPPVWCDEPYEIRQILSYCDTSVHQGTLYRAANFRLMRTNERGIETYVRDVRHLTHVEHAAIRNASQLDERARRLRNSRECKRKQLSFEWSEVAI